MCRVLGVNRSGYYSFQQRQANRVDDPLHEEMLECVKKIVIKSDYTYGCRRVKKAMNTLSYPISRRKASALMKEAGVEVRHKRKFKVTTNSNHKLPLFDNLLKREFRVEQPDRAYVSRLLLRTKLFFIFFLESTNYRISYRYRLKSFHQIKIFRPKVYLSHKDIF